MKVLYICNDLPFFTSHFLVLVKRSIDSGNHVTALVGGVTQDSSERLRATGCHLRPMSLSRSGVNPIRELFAVFEIAQAIRSGKYDLVHLFTIKPCIYGGILARFLKTPKVVATVTGLGYSFSDKGRLSVLRGRALLWTYKLAFGGGARRVQMVFENSDDQDFFQQAGVIAPARTARVWGAGVDLERFFPPGYREDDVQLGRYFKILLPARMLKDKGVLEFIEAARWLKNADAPVLMVLVGDVDPNNPASLRTSEIQSAVREGVVDWLGYCEDMPYQLRCADVVCLPSYREGMPKVLLEAMASGKPIITTDAPGCREAIEPGVEGVLVPVGSSRGLVEAISMLVENPQIITDMGRAARRRAELLFRDTGIADKYLAIYDRL